MDGGDAGTLTKIAIFCIAFSMITTMLCAVYASGSGDYDYDTISYYQSQLSEYTGGNLVNDSPWVLTSVYTPFIPGDYGSDIENHVDEDGWLYGSSVAYGDIGEAANIALDKNYKSNQKLSVGDPLSESYITGETNLKKVLDVVGGVFNTPSWAVYEGLNAIGFDAGDGYKYNTVSANNWNYTGYRYVFDPTLPFSNGTSSKNGSLSIVWYDYDDQSGISGGLVIYGSNNSDQTVVLADYSASDIIAGYQASNGYATTYDFNFDGTHLNLSVRFDPDAINTYGSLRAAWDAGAWTMAVSSASAGNFFDVENSNAFTATAGTMFDTFVQIFTFDYPKFSGEGQWANIVLWLMVGLPMTMGLLLITARTVGGIFKVF